MSNRQTPVGFGIYDLLTRVTPGAIFLLIVSSSVVTRTDTLSRYNLSIYFVIFAILSLVIGEAINKISNTFFLPPTSFRRFLYEQDIGAQLGPLDSIKYELPYISTGESGVTTIAGDKFWELFTSHLLIDEEYSNSSDIYKIFIGYMEPRLTSRTRRQQTVFHFVNNTMLAIAVGVLFVIAKILLDYTTVGLSDTTIRWSLLIVFLAVFTVYMIGVAFGFQESDFVSNAFVEYYIDRVENNEINKNDSDIRQTTLDSRFDGDND